MIKKRIAEYRTLPANEKGLEEQREELINEMESIVNAAKGETRTLTDEEEKRYTDLKTQVEKIDKSISIFEEERAHIEKKPVEKKEEERALEEERAFENYVRGAVSAVRTGEQNLTMGNNGAIIPSTIANRIIKAVQDRCPILQRATMYNVKGTLKIPVYGKSNTTHDITVGYQSEFTAPTADVGAFTSVDLGGFLAGALSMIGLSVVNNAQVDVTSFIVNEMADKIASFLENQLLNGTGSSAAQGITNGTNTVSTGAATAITADELITLQAKVKQVYQANACWIMSPDVFLAIKKLKDGNNRYLLQDNITGEFPYMLLGKPVFLSDNMSGLAAGNKTVVYGDLSGLAVNFREQVQIQILKERYADLHAIGVISWFEFDSKVIDNQRFSILVQKAS